MSHVKNFMKAAALAVALPAAANASMMEGFFINPYVGAELGWRHLPWETAFGERHFRENFSNANVVVGAKVHQYFAIEGGYQTTNRQEKQEYYHGDNTVVEPILGFIDPGADASLHISQAELRGWHVNLIGKLPLDQTTELYALLGVAWNRFYVSTAPVFANAPANLVSHWQSDKKSMLRLGAGLDKMLTSNFGVRASIVWEGTGTLEGTTVGTAITNPPVNSTELYTAKSKDSYVLGLGFYYQLCPNQA